MVRADRPGSADALLAGTGWRAPAATAYPTGDDWVAGYLSPSPTRSRRPTRSRSGSAIVSSASTRFGRDRLVDSGREDEPLILQVETGHGVERITASAVIDASGTWGGPNPLGGDGLPALGEAAHAERISYRVPDCAATQGR